MTAVAQAFANYHQVAGRSVQLNAADVQLGSWDSTTRTFTPGATVGTAVKVTVRTDANSGGKTGLFFGKLFGLCVDQPSRPRPWPPSIPATSPSWWTSPAR